MNKYIKPLAVLSIAVIFGIGLFADNASAQTSEQIIQQLQAQIAVLQAQLDIMSPSKPEPIPTPTPTPVPSECPVFWQTLYRGVGDASAGGEVTKLQKMLAEDPVIYPEGLITGYYGPLTEKAVQRWQAKQGIVSSGNAATTGYGVVGLQTRAKISAVCPTPIPTPTSTPTLIGPPDTINVINVLNYGAKGDGVTDDTAAFQQAVSSGRGKTVLVPKPAVYYRLSQPYGAGAISVYSNTKIIGEKGSRIHQATTGNIIFEILDSSKNVEIANLTLTSEGTETEAMYGRGIIDSDRGANPSGISDNIYIHDNVISNAPIVGISGTFRNSKIINNTITIPINTGEHGIYVTNGSTNVLIENNKITGPGRLLSVAAGIKLGSSNNVTIRGNTIDNANTAGILLAEPGSTNVLIENNNIIKTYSPGGGNGIYIHDGSGITVRNNTINSAQFIGIDVRVPGVILDRNTITNSTYWAIDMNVTSSINAIIKNNICSFFSINGTQLCLKLYLPIYS